VATPENFLTNSRFSQQMFRGKQKKKRDDLDEIVSVAPREPTEETGNAEKK
jgi:hypothetical protein